MSNQLKITNEQIIKETEKEIENIKNKTREAGVRIFKKCDEMENVAEFTDIMLDDQTDCMRTISSNLDVLDEKIKESKSLAKQFGSWFGIFNSTRPIVTEHMLKNENTNTDNHRKFSENKTSQNYEFNSDDPAEEIAKKLEERIDKIEKYAIGYNQKLKTQDQLINKISDKVDKSNYDIRNVTKIIKKY